MDKEGRSRSITKRKPIWVVMDSVVERNMHKPDTTRHNGNWDDKADQFSDIASLNMVRDIFFPQLLFC